MADIKFGKSQLGKPIPIGIGLKVMIISGICGIVQTWMGTAAYIPNHVSNILTSVLGLFIAVCNFVLPFIGVSQDEEQAVEQEIKK